MLPLSVELLGPVRAWREGVEVDVGAARRRAVFAMLAVRAGQAVSRDELIDGVWGDSPPATAGASLYTYVSGLRRAFEPQRAKRGSAEIVVSTDAGYSLRINDAGLDVCRFEQHRVRAHALAAADAGRALDELEQGLRLWHGDALSGVPGPFAQSQRARLFELRLATVERRAELALAVGGGAEVVAELSGLVAEHPMREGLRALLITALHREGRAAEALAVYRDARRMLVDELGIEPGPALRRAHQEVLGGDGPREPAIMAGRLHRASVPELEKTGVVGRERELALLRRAVVDVVQGRGRAVWVEGEPGIGKSVLLAAGLAAAADTGCTVGWATCDELGWRFPLRVVLDGLEVTTSSPDRRRVALAEALIDPVDTSTGWPAGDPLSDAVDRLLSFVEGLCAEAPLVLVVDGLQWADEASVVVWHRLLRLVHRLPLLLVAAARPVPRRPDLVRVRRAVAESGGDVVGLAALPAAEVAALVTGLVGASAGDNLRRLVAHAGGNPLYVREAVDWLLREGLDELGDGIAEPEMPPSLVSSLTRRLGFLSPEATEVLRWAALLGTEFSVGDAATVAARPVSDLVAVVDEATAAGVLADAGPRLAFRHPLVRHALYYGMPGAVRTALHRQAAESLAKAGASVEVVAGQLAAARTVVDPWVADWLAVNADAVAKNAADLAAGLLRTAVDQPTVDPVSREQLAGRLAELLFRLGGRPDAEARYVLARTRDGGLAAEMRWMLVHLRHMRDLEGGTAEPAESVEALRVTVADDGVPPIWRARLEALLAAVLAEVQPIGEAAEEMAWRALRRAEDVRDDFAAAHAWRVLGQVSSARLDQEEALARVDRGLAVVRARADLRGMHAALSADKACTLRDLDRLADADLVLRASRESAEPSTSGAVRVATAVQHYWLGRWDDAVREGGPHDVDRLVAVRRGRVALARHHVDTGNGFWSAAEAFVAEAAGQVDQAIAVLEPLLGAPRTRGRHQWLPLLTRLALAAGRSEIAVRAAQVCAQDAAAERVRAGAAAAAAHCLGLVEGDPAPVLAAARRYREVGRPVELAEALENAAVLIAACGDDTGARTVFEEAVACYGRLGAVLDVRRAEARLLRFSDDGMGRTG